MTTDLVMAANAAAQEQPSVLEAMVRNHSRMVYRIAYSKRQYQLVVTVSKL